MKTVAIIQARMGSSRFPGKMLAKLGNISVLEWVIIRVKQAKLIDQIIIATSDRLVDDPIEILSKSYSISVLRGSETDVLGRFLAAGKLTDADYVVRICADNPFIDPVEIDKLVDFFQSDLCDYAYNHQDRNSNGYADGFGAEILSFSLLKSIEESAVQLKHREHSTLWIWDHQSDYEIKTIAAPVELAYPMLRFDVDTGEDLAYLQSLVNDGINPDSSAKEVVEIALKKKG